MYMYNILYQISFYFYLVKSTHFLQREVQSQPFRQLHPPLDAPLLHSRNCVLQQPRQRFLPIPSTNQNLCPSDQEESLVFGFQSEPNAGPSRLSALALPPWQLPIPHQSIVSPTGCATSTFTQLRTPTTAPTSLPLPSTNQNLCPSDQEESLVKKEFLRQTN